MNINKIDINKTDIHNINKNIYKNKNFINKVTEGMGTGYFDDGKLTVLATKDILDLMESIGLIKGETTIANFDAQIEEFRKILQKACFDGKSEITLNKDALRVIFFTTPLDLLWKWCDENEIIYEESEDSVNFIWT